MEQSKLTRDGYHQKMLDMIAENLRAQGYTQEELKQYHLDRMNSISETDAMKKLHRSNAA